MCLWLLEFAPNSCRILSLLCCSSTLIVRMPLPVSCPCRFSNPEPSLLPPDILLHFVEHATAGHFCLSNLEPHLVLCWSVVREPATCRTLPILFLFLSLGALVLFITLERCLCAFERVFLLPGCACGLVVPVLLPFDRPLLCVPLLFLHLDFLQLRQIS